MNNTAQIDTLKNLSSYVRSAQDDLSNSDLKVLYNFAKRVYSKASNDVSSNDFGCGLGSDYMKTAATVIGSDEASLTAKHEFADGVKNIDDQKKLYTKANDAGKIKLCKPRDFVGILNNIVSSLENNNNSSSKNQFDNETSENNVANDSKEFKRHFLNN